MRSWRRSIPNASLADIDVEPFAVAMATAELFDPATGSWSKTGPMTYARTGAAAAHAFRRPVLVFGSGGGAGSGVTVDDKSHASAEIYDPTTGRFQLAGTLPPLDRAALEAQGPPNANPIPTDDGEIGPGTIVALPDGDAMLIGVTYYWKHVADITRSFRYDAASNKWSEIGQTWVNVGERTAIPLYYDGVPNLDGAVAELLPGRSCPRRRRLHAVNDGHGRGGWPRQPPVRRPLVRRLGPTNAFSDAPRMPIPRTFGQSVALKDGSVFVFGGEHAGRRGGSATLRGLVRALGGRHREPLRLGRHAGATRSNGRPVRRRERRSESMIKIWSELPVARTREQVADIATLIWVVFWGSIVVQLFAFLIGFAGVGRAVHEGGENMIQGGRRSVTPWRACRSSAAR
jgi:hypothetical protein